MNLFRACFTSLSYKRELPDVYRNLILAAAGLVIFLVGFFVAGGIPSVWIIGAVVLGGFGLWALIELSILLSVALRARSKGQILYAVAVRAEPIRWKNRRYRLYVDVELPEGKRVETCTQGPLWEVDAKVLLSRRFRVIYLGPKRNAVLIPEYQEKRSS